MRGFTRGIFIDIKTQQEVVHGTLDQMRNRSDTKLGEDVNRSTQAFSSMRRNIRSSMRMRDPGLRAARG